MKYFSELGLLLFFLAVVEQMGVSMRCKAVEISDTGCCLGINGTKCLLATRCLQLKVDNFTVKSVIKLSKSGHCPKTALGLCS